MLDADTYRISEELAKSQVPSWRVSQIHNVDHFERAGFPVRLKSMLDLGQIVDTMQENRFDKYVDELGGLTKQEFDMIVRACNEAVRFQCMFLPTRPVVLPISTLISSFALYKKISGAQPDVSSVLEIGPGCGYLSFFLNKHAPLVNYSQIEACESFYILQNLVNLFCFGETADERALPASASSLDYFVNPRPDMEFSPRLKVSRRPRCVHYPWWRIGEIATREIQFDVITSNANLLEFNSSALDDYLSLILRALKPEGHFVVQCTGFPASGTVEQLMEKLRAKGFASLLTAIEGKQTRLGGAKGLGNVLDGSRTTTSFTTNNLLLIRPGHSLHDKYAGPQSFQPGFAALEPVVRRAYFDRPADCRKYEITDFISAVEQRWAQ
jgi:SAM-dependent methyltransferase